MIDSNNGNNGNNPMPSGAVLSWKPGSGGNAKELLSIEKDRKLDYEVPEIALKTILRDDDEALDFAQAIHHCVEFEMKDMLKELYTLLALKPAVNGMSRMQFLSGITGVIWDFNSKKPLMDQFKDNKRAESKDSNRKA